jgi:tRNA pseudouridine55 synthase
VIALDGILLIDKPPGLTSHDVVRWIRKTLNIKRIGHGGTLDPAATGLLVVLVGSATKLFPYLSGMDKEYTGEVTVGVATDSADADGAITAEKTVEGPLVIDEALMELCGEREQVPPMYSAVKSSGKKLYELARRGVTVERTPRPITVYELERTSPVSYENGRARFSFRTRVSKGTYIRTLAVEIGERLGYPAYLSMLRRLTVGGFSLKKAHSLDEVARGDYRLLPLLSVFSENMVIQAGEKLARKARNGRALDAAEVGSGEPEIAIANGEELIAIYKRKNGTYHAERVWN